MTMRLTIKNDDTSRTAVLKYVDTPSGEKKQEAAGELAPGESREFWIHSTRSLEVEEK